MTDETTTHDDRLAALQRYVRDQTMAPLPKPPAPTPGSFADEASRAYEYRRQLRIQAAVETAAADQAQAAREAPARARREAERADVAAAIVAENERHEGRIRELSRLQLDLAHAPLRKRVVR